MLKPTASASLIFICASIIATPTYSTTYVKFENTGKYFIWLQADMPNDSLCPESLRPGQKTPRYKFAWHASGKFYCYYMLWPEMIQTQCIGHQLAA